MLVNWLKILKLKIVVVLLLDNASGQFEAEHRIRCNEAYCAENQIVCPPEPNCTTIGFREFLNPAPCNCCGYCFEYLEEGAPCRTQSGLPNSMCGPRLQCNDDGTEETCGTMIGPDDSCSGALAAYLKRQEDGTAGIADFQPHCNARGQFSPRQCLPASSICICMSEDGRGIFGMAFAKDMMDCTCSRDAARLDEFGLLRDFPHCRANGNYDTLICSLRKRTCHCRFQPSKIVNFNMMKELDCYDSSRHTEQYLKPCEMERGELDTLIYDSEVNGTAILVGDFPRCDPDGSYAAVQSRLESWICADTDGDQIEDYGVAKTNVTALEPPSELTCLCARIRHFLGDNAGKPKCCPSGNFRLWQCTGSTCYCVDQLGRQDMTLDPYQVDRDNVDQLSCYGADVECPSH